MSWADESLRRLKSSDPSKVEGSSADEFATIRPSSEKSLEDSPRDSDARATGDIETEGAVEESRPEASALSADDAATLVKDETLAYEPTVQKWGETRDNNEPLMSALTGVGAGITPPEQKSNPEEFWSSPTIDAQGDLRTGDVVFRRYRVLGKLGQGGNGKVWLVQHETLKKARALKTIISHNAFDKSARSRFRREAELMAELEHPNAVVIHDAQISKDFAFIEMEYVEGKSLSDYLKDSNKEPMPLDWTARVLIQLCNVLQVAHDQGIIHRDLKPSNLMLKGKNPKEYVNLKVLDWGLAKSLNSTSLEDSFHTITASFMGTPPYTSPEQACGEAERRSDIYSTGVILFQMLTGVLPFRGNQAQMITATLKAPPPSFQEANPEANVPAAVENVVLRCLSKEMEGRPQTPADLLSEFLAALPEETRVKVATQSDSAMRLPPISVETASRLAPITVESATRVPPIVPDTMTVQPDAEMRKRKIKRGLLIGIPLAATLAAGIVSRFVRFTPPPPPPPSGYEQVVGTDRVEGWPRIIVHMATGARFVRVPGGQFVMGAIEQSLEDPKKQPSAHPDELPRHQVYLDGYYMQESEVTFGQMELFFDERRGLARPSEYLDKLNSLKAVLSVDEALLHPAVYVSRDLAMHYAEWVNGRLPTEAEWEYAARSRGKDYLYVWGNESKPLYTPGEVNINRTDDCIVCTTKGRSDPDAKVNEGKSDMTGGGQRLFDMAGNVREWCLDVWARYAGTPQENPEGPRSSGADEDRFVIRGGSFVTTAESARTTSRIAREASSFSQDDLGFRVVVPTSR